MDRPLNVLMLAACPFPAPQGSQTLVAGMGTALARAGCRARLVVYPGGVGPLPEGVEFLSCGGIGARPRIRAGPWWGKPLINQRLRAAFRRALQQERPDIVHAHNIEALLIGAPIARRAGVPVVYGAHGRMGLELPSYFRRPILKRPAAAYGARLDRRAARLADGVHALTDAEAVEWHALGVPPERALSAPPGIDLEAFDRAPAAAPPIDREDAGPLIVYGGNLDGYQGLGVLREAFSALLREAPQARLILASHVESGVYESAQREWGGTRRVQFVRVDSFGAMKALLLAADILVNPRSLPGGFPMKLLNYMAAGRAIVSCRGTAGVLRDGEDAILIEDGNAAEFAGAIGRLGRDPGLRDHLGRAARMRCQRELDWKMAIGPLIEFYSKLAS